MAFVYFLLCLRKGFILSCIAAVRQHDSLRKQGTTVAAVGGIRALNYFVLITVQHMRVCVCVHIMMKTITQFVSVYGKKTHIQGSMVQMFSF